MCKRFFKFALQLSSYWKNINFSRNCPKFHVVAKIIIFLTATIQLETILIIACMHGEECVNISTPHPLVPLSVMRMNFDSPQIFLDCVGYQQYYKPANCPTFGGTVPLFELAKVKKRESPTFLKCSVMANFTVWTTENDVNFTWNFYFSIFTSLLW